MEFTIKDRIWAERWNITVGRSRLERKAYYDKLNLAKAKERREVAAKTPRPLTKKEARNLASLQLARKLAFSGKSAREKAWANLKRQWAFEDALEWLETVGPEVIYGE